MNKEQIIQFIEEQIHSGKISREDLALIVRPDIPNIKPEKVSAVASNSKSLISILYAIGAIIAIVGISILTYQHWDEIGFPGRIIVTLGIALCLYIVALLLNKPEHRTISQVFFTISAALAPLGSYVLVNNFGISFDYSTQLVVALIIGVIFSTALYISRRNILVLLTTAFFTWGYYALIFKIFEMAGFSGSNLLKWVTILLGVSYVLVAYGRIRVDSAVVDRESKSVNNILYGLGTLAFLGGGIAVGGSFDLLYILFIFGAFYVSIFLRSQSMMIFAAIFLMAHIIKLTSKYFVNSIGWPIALIVVGFLVICIGYLTFYLSKKYISR